MNLRSDHPDLTANRCRAATFGSGSAGSSMILQARLPSTYPGRTSSWSFAAWVGGRVDDAHSVSIWLDRQSSARDKGRRSRGNCCFPLDRGAVCHRSNSLASATIKGSRIHCEDQRLRESLERFSRFASTNDGRASSASSARSLGAIINWLDGCRRLIMYGHGSCASASS